LGAQEHIVHIFYMELSRLIRSENRAYFFSGTIYKIWIAIASNPFTSLPPSCEQTALTQAAAVNQPGHRCQPKPCLSPLLPIQMRQPLHIQISHTLVTLRRDLPPRLLPLAGVVHQATCPCRPRTFFRHHAPFHHFQRADARPRGYPPSVYQVDEISRLCPGGCLCQRQEMVTPCQQRIYLSLRLSCRDRLGETRHQ